MIAAFIGHRNIESEELLSTRLKEIIISLIDNKQVDTFLFGSKSDFDSLCLDVVTEIKKDRPNIKLVYVRSAYAYMSKDYEEYLLSFYDETYIPDNVVDAGRASYVERNYHMIDKANLCIFYYNENYEPPQKPMSRKHNMPVPTYKRNSGTKTAYEYAVKRKKEIINLYTLLSQ